jgi:hypothetical protein
MDGISVWVTRRASRVPDIWALAMADEKLERATER